jgi:DNA-binding IclR family transcriptional regulator
MRDLAVSTGESIYLSVRRSDDLCLYVAAAQGTHPIRYENWVGRTFSPENSAAGSLLMGTVPENGYVIFEAGVDPDVTAIAAPVLIDGQPVAALSALVPSYRTDASRSATIGVALIAAVEEFGRASLSSDDLPES